MILSRYPSWEASITTAPNGELLTAREKLLFLILVDCDRAHSCTALSRLAELALCSVRQTRRLLRGLERKKLLRIEGRPGDINQYFILGPPGNLQLVVNRPARVKRPAARATSHGILARERPET